MSIRVVANDLKPADNHDHFRLHCAALEWSLAEPIIINSAEDIKSSVDWRDRFEPYYHQVQNLMRFCRRLPVTLLADDVGLGKTISAGLIISELVKRSRVSKVLVICPKILIPQWIEELDSKFGIPAYGAVGSEIKSSRNRTEPVIVTTYQSATGFLEQQQAGLFDMLILDEAHKVRNLHGTPNPPKMATAVFKALEARLFKYVVMLTATPIQNRLWDIYSLVDCLAVARGHKNPFGTPDQFANRFIADSRNVARRLKSAHTEEFRKIVNSYMFRTRRVDAKLAFPDRQVQLVAVKAQAGEMQLQKLIAQNISNFNALQQTSLLVALMSSPHALAAQLENMAANNTADHTLAFAAKEALRSILVPAKTEAVLKIASDLRKQNDNWRMVVFTTRKETQRMLGEVMTKAGIACGFIAGGEPTKNRNTIEAFRAERAQINVVISTDAGAEGVNLQAANVLVNYDLPWNPMVVEQRIGRVQRIGSKFRNVWVANIVHQNSPEQRIVGRLMEKLQVISHTVGDIEAVLEATGDPNGDTLEKQIRQMVVASLKGQDQEAATRKAEDSILAAKKLIDQTQAEMDQTLGNGKQSDEVDIPMPRLTPAAPSIKIEEFVISALRAEGAEVTDTGDGLYSARSTGLGEERFTFSEKVLQRFTQPGVFMGRSPLLYQPGKPAFERLIQRWIDRSSAMIVDLRVSQDEAKRMAGDWVDTIRDAQFSNAKIIDRHESFLGNLICRTRVSNAIDSYEKLIRVGYESNGTSVANNTDLTSIVPVKSLVPEPEEKIDQQVGRDEDITRFKEYYEERLRAELECSDSGERKSKLVNDLAPIVVADTSAMDGKLSDSVKILVRYSLGTSFKYESPLELAGGQIVHKPPIDRCAQTGRRVPIDCLERCSVTDKRVLRELLERSDESGQFALPDTFSTCEVSGKKVHQRELGKCCISGKQVCKSLLLTSAMSGRSALAEHVSKCELTGALLVKDELETSSLSGKRFRSDESVKLVDGNQIAHKSEATRCAFSGKWFRNEDCVLSDVSQRPVGKNRLAYSELSNKKCDVSELRVCGITGARLLPDEIGHCCISDKQVRIDLLSECPETGRKAQSVYMSRCEESKQLVLPEMLGTCSLTQKKVRKSLLGKSGVSGKVCLASRLTFCQVNGTLLMPDEVAICAVTGKRVDARLTQTCVVSGKTVLESKLVRSKASSQWMLPEHTKKLPNGMVVGKDEVAVCTWTRKYLRVDQTAKCNLCGLIFARNLMNASGEFALLRECLDGKQKGTMFPEPGYLARVLPKVFSGIMVFQWTSSETGQAHVMFGKKSTFGLNAKVFAVMAEGDLTGLTLRGKTLFGKRVQGVWQPLG